MFSMNWIEMKMKCFSKNCNGTHPLEEKAVEMCVALESVHSNDFYQTDITI